MGPCLGEAPQDVLTPTLLTVPEEETFSFDKVSLAPSTEITWCLLLRRNDYRNFFSQGMY